LSNNAIQSLRALDADVDVAAANTTPRLVLPTTSVVSATDWIDRVGQKQTPTPPSRRPQVACNADAMTVTTFNTK
jgi:hypothetical protein